MRIIWLVKQQGKLLLFLIIIYFFITLIGALRLSIAFNGYPIKAMAVPLEERELSLEKDTKGILTNWSVKNILYFI